MVEIHDSTHSEIKRICKNADKMADRGCFKDALTEYLRAYDLIPEPKAEWDDTLWILVAIGDVYFLSHEFNAGVDTFNKAMNYPAAIDNPFVHLRLGQCEFEVGNFDKAVEELKYAYDLDNSILNEENHKYFNFLRSRNIIKKKKPWWFFSKD